MKIIYNSLNEFTANGKLLHKLVYKKTVLKAMGITLWNEISGTDETNICWYVDNPTKLLRLFILNELAN
jgi:hypothetical protein